MSGLLGPASLPDHSATAANLAQRYIAAAPDLWNGWRELLRSRGVAETDLCLDGPAIVETYFSSSPRVLFILREPNDCRGDELLALLRTEAKWRAWRSVARWAAGIRSGFAPFDEVQQQRVQNEALRSIAAINIKKSSGGSSSHLATIYDYAVGASELHRTQISLLQPDLVIAAGTIHELAAIVKLESRGTSSYSGITPDGRGFRAVSWHHPSARGSARISYDRLRELYQQESQSTG